MIDAQQVLTTFPKINEYRKAIDYLDHLGEPYEVISPGPGYGSVGVPSVVIATDTQALLTSIENNFICSGWIDYRLPKWEVPQSEPSVFENEIWGETAIMVLAPCVADREKIRIVAHISGNLAEVFPYLNTFMKTACYNRHAPNLTYMDQYRMICLYPHRIAVAKVDDIVDAWRVLEEIRIKANQAWQRRTSITPSFEMRKKPPALEIFKRLPATNCRECGELTCMAFAVKLWQGVTIPSRCKPVFNGNFDYLRVPLLEICRGLHVGFHDEE